MLFELFLLHILLPLNYVIPDATFFALINKK